MTIVKRYTAPTLPLPPQDYAQTYGNELIKILRLYFNDNDSTVNAIIALLNAGGYFPAITAGTVTAGDFVGGDFTGDNITVTNANFPILNSPGIQGGNGVFDNLTGSNVNGSVFTGSGRQINFPHIGASGNADQYATADDTPTIVSWDTADELLGFTLNVDNTATPTYSGVYKITYGLQFANTDNAPHDVVIWIKVNGSDVAKSAVKYTLPARKSAGVPSYLLAGSTIVFDIQAGQSVGLWWATDKAYSTTGPVDGVYIEYIPAQTSPYAHPAAPAAIGDITYMSAPFPPRTQITPIGVLASGKIGTPVISIINNT